MESNNVKEVTKKQELNNHIVCMRKCVRQAKVHVIRKLTREVKKLRDRKGSEEIQLKSKRKADRLYLEITTIKHLKEDKVSISALYNTLKLEEVLQNPKSTIDERATARLIHHPSINTQIQNYRKANPNWKLQIPVLLEKNPVKLKKAQKKEIEKEKKKQQNKTDTVIKTTTSTDNNEPLENSLKVEEDDDKESTDEENEINSSENEINQESSDDEGIESEDIEEQEENEEEEIEKPVETKSNKKVEKSKLIQPNLKKKNNQNKQDNIILIKPEPLVLNKTEGTIKVQVINDWTEFGDEEEEKTSHNNNNNKSEPSSSSTSNDKIKKPKSSFFLGCVDKNINDKPEKQVQQHYDDNLNRRARRGNVPIKPQRDFNKLSDQNRNNNKWGVQNNNKSGSGDKFNKFSSNNNKKDFDKQRPPRYFDKNSSSSFNNQERKTNLLQPDYLKKNREAPKTGPPEKLHPSWEAKKRQSVILPSFQGKKIKFDD